jgi:hypothetical protein
VLQVSKSADDASIKRAYRKLAVKYHPVRGEQRSMMCTQGNRDCLGTSLGWWPRVRRAAAPPMAAWRARALA